MTDFCDNYNVKNLIKEPTCFTNHVNPSCIDLILRSRSRSFQNTSVMGSQIFIKWLPVLSEAFIQNISQILVIIEIIRNSILTTSEMI